MAFDYSKDLYGPSFCRICGKLIPYIKDDSKRICSDCSKAMQRYIIEHAITEYEAMEALKKHGWQEVTYNCETFAFIKPKIGRRDMDG